MPPAGSAGSPATALSELLPTARDLQTLDRRGHAEAEVDHDTLVRAVEHRGLVPFGPDER